MSLPPRLFLVSILIVVSAPTGWAQTPRRAEILERTLANLRAGRIDRPILRWQQARSANFALYADQSAVALPREPEIERYLRVRDGSESEALDYLDLLYGRRDDLKALAVRDSDGDGVPDFRVSDYYGKFMEGDVDLDGDGVRNLYDSHPFDRARGATTTTGSGAFPLFEDANANGVPDTVDWALHDDDSELTAIQQGLFRDYQILLVNRNATFDTVLARAADDVIRRVFRAYFEEHATLPTLRTIAAETTALLNAVVAYIEEDDTSAQFFSQTQSLIVYDTGRNVDVALGVVGLLVHEIGHSYHMSLDFDVSDELGENGRVSFPAPSFVELVKRFGWTTSSYYDGNLDAGLALAPRFVYAGVSEPEFVFHDESPEAWESWLEDLYEQLNQAENYLESSDVAALGIVSDYSLSSPYEWYADNLIAYVVSVLEEEALKSLSDANAVVAARRDVDAALRSVWPGFYHRNLAPDVRDYFEKTFPITSEDRQFLATRYLDPILSR